MSERQNKKLKRLFRKDYRQTIEVIAKANSQLFKPKPRWVPTFVWMFLLGFFVKIKK